jgi:hypothetical protein
MAGSMTFFACAPVLGATGDVQTGIEMPLWRAVPDPTLPVGCPVLTQRGPLVRYFIVPSIGTIRLVQKILGFLCGADGGIDVSRLHGGSDRRK